jgi:hypothetical protein
MDLEADDDFPVAPAAGIGGIARFAFLTHAELRASSALVIAQPRPGPPERALPAAARRDLA